MKKTLYLHNIGNDLPSVNRLSLGKSLKKTRFFHFFSLLYHDLTQQGRNFGAGKILNGEIITMI